MKKVLVIGALATLLLTSGVSAQAAESMFGPFKIGPEATLYFGGDDDDRGNSSGFGIGVRGEYDMQELVGLPLSLAATFDYIFVDCPGGVDCTVFETNLNGMYTLPIPVPDMFQVYAGGGLNLTYVKAEYLGASDSDSDFSLNVLAGSKFNLGMMFTPFAEFKFELGSAPWFGITGGVLF